MAEYRNIGNHAEDLASGRMLAPGESAELTDEEVKLPHNEDKIASGILLPLGQPKKTGKEGGDVK